jgi:lactate dehydrogenase-like 2-hydroxyacid dehydrogenase
VNGERVAPILVTRRLPSSALAILREAGEVEVSDVAMEPAALQQAARGRTAIVSLLTDRITAEVIAAAGPSLKIVANVAVGYDNIDVAAARAHGVIVTNTPDVLTNSVAEFTWGLILAITRRIGEGERLVRRGAWAGWSLEFMTGMELAGKQLGVVGAGRIGRAVAAKAGAFGMQVVYAAHGGATSLDGHSVVSLDELLVSSDVVSLNVPLRSDTRHLIDRRALARMTRTAYLINTARGPVVDEEALAWALAEHLIAGAALDVFEREPAVHPNLLPLENVLLVPHIGSATRETRTAMAELAAKNAAAVLRGQPPLTPLA